jgi:soluble lytic murein transglycosylase
LGRKALRKSMLAAYDKGAFGDAVVLGNQLRDNYGLDWEAQFIMAQAQRRGGDASAALAEYLAFAEAYSDNVYADDAQFWAAEILAERGQRSEAAELYRAVIANPKTNLRQRAKKRLAAVTH